MIDRERYTDRRWGRGLLASVIVIGFFVCLITLFVVSTKGDASLESAKLLMIGTLQTTFGAVVGYYFGSTTGSDRKTELLANSTPVPANPVVVTSTTDTALGRQTSAIVPARLQTGVVVSYAEGIASIKSATGEMFTAAGETEVGHIVTFRDGMIETSEAPPVVQPTAPPTST